MDNLSDDEKVLAWEAIWKPNFSGIAIVDPDYTFRAVNDQFCEIMGVTPAELVGNKVTDVTAVEIKELDAKNAELVKAGVISTYMLPKTYVFPRNQRVDVILLVKGVYSEVSGEFLFFVSQVMENKSNSLLEPPYQRSTGLSDWIDKKRIGMGLLALMAAVGYGVVQYIIETWGK